MQSTKLASRSGWRWLPLLAGLVMMLWSAGGARVEAHAYVVRSDPPAQAVVPTAPATVSIWFSEWLEPSATTAKLIDQRGQEVPGTSYRIGEPKQLIITLPGGLANGTYSIVWRNISQDDGHPANGYLPFTIGTFADVQAVAPPVEAADTAGAPQWLRTTARWLAFLGLFGAVAVWPVWCLVLAGPLRRVRGAMLAALPVIGRVAVGAVLLALLGNLAALLVQAAEPGGDYTNALRETIEHTRYGTLMLWRVGLLTLHALVLSFVLWQQPWKRLPVTGLAMLTSAALVAPFSLNAHAAAQPAGRGFAIASDMVHLGGASIWAGGVAVLLIVLVGLWRRVPPADTRAVVVGAIPRFSALAIAAWICIAATGAYAAWLDVGSVDAARDTAYGRTFLIKMALALLLLGVGAFHLWFITKRVSRQSEEGRVWTRRFQVLLGVEVALLLAIVLVTGRMTSLPPAREADAPAPAQPGITRELQANGIAGVLLISPGETGQNVIRLQLVSDAIPADAEALLRLTGPDPGMGTHEITLTADGPGVWSTSGSHLSVDGNWSIDAIVRKVGAFQWQASTRVELASGSGGTASGGESQPAPWHLGDLAILGLVPLMLIASVIGYWIALGRHSNLPPEAEAEAEVRPLQSGKQARLRPGSGRR